MYKYLKKSRTSVSLQRNWMFTLTTDFPLTAHALTCPHIHLRAAANFAAT